MTFSDADVKPPDVNSSEDPIKSFLIESDYHDKYDLIRPKSPEGPPPPINSEMIFKNSGLMNPTLMNSTLMNSTLRKSKSYDGPQLKKYFHFNKSKSYNSLLYTIEDSDSLEKLDN